MNVSSERSEYSPTIRLAVRMPLLRDSLVQGGTAIVVRVDSGVITAHGVLTPSELVVMRNLKITAVVATFPTEGSQRGSLAHPWAELARSADQHLTDSLRYGEGAGLPPMTFVIPIRHERSRVANGLVFEITGIAMSTPVRLVTGELRPGRTLGEGSIRVFACSIFRLDGSIDGAREKNLRARYVDLC